MHQAYAAVLPIWGNKNRGSMDPVHILMNPVHGPGPQRGFVYCTLQYFTAAYISHVGCTLFSISLANPLLLQPSFYWILCDGMVNGIRRNGNALNLCFSMHHFMAFEWR